MYYPKYEIPKYSGFQVSSPKVQRTVHGARLKNSRTIRITESGIRILPACDEHLNVRGRDADAEARKLDDSIKTHHHHSYYHYYLFGQHEILFYKNRLLSLLRTHVVILCHGVLFATALLLAKLHNRTTGSPRYGSAVFVVVVPDGSDRAVGPTDGGFPWTLSEFLVLCHVGARRLVVVPEYQSE